MQFSVRVDCFDTVTHISRLASRALRSNHVVLCNKGYPSETHLELKPREISFVHNILFNNPIVLNFCTEHGSITAVFYAKFQMIGQLRQMFWKICEIKMSFGRISYITQHPCSLWINPTILNHSKARHNVNYAYNSDLARSILWPQDVSELSKMSRWLSARLQ